MGTGLLPKIIVGGNRYSKRPHQSKVTDYATKLRDEQGVPLIEFKPKKKLGDFVVDCLDLFTTVKWTKGLVPTGFDGAEILLDADRTHTWDSDVVRMDLIDNDLIHRLDYTTITPDENSWPGFNRVRQVRMEEVRGKLGVVMPVMVENSVAMLNSTQRRFITQRPTIFGMRRDGAWIPLTQGLEDNVAHAEMGFWYQSSLGFQFLRQYQWRVYFAYAGHPGVELPTDPVGAQQVFRLRDIPNGKHRRQALVHWVDEHWRHTRNDPMIETQVRSHLRGAQDFDWNGLVCRIRPAEVDLFTAAVLKEERRAIKPKRIAGEDINVPVRPWWLRVLMSIRGGK